MQPLTLGFIKNVLSTEGSATERLTSLCTDTRTLKKGDTFLALKGDQFDGHRFVDTALQGGAALAIVNRADYAGPPSSQILAVDDTVQAYRSIAATWREHFKGPACLIAGAVGKTTTKELLAALLAGKFSSVLKTGGSENGFIGIPKTLLRIENETDAAVLEVGIDDVGTMSQHLDLVQPTLSILTAIEEEHLENLKDLKTVAHEELLSLRWTHERQRPTLVRVDDPLIEKATRDWVGAHVTRYAMNSPKADFSGTFKGQTLSITPKSGSPFELECPLPGTHNGLNLLAAASVAHCLGLSPDEMRTGLSQHFESAQGRGQIWETEPDLVFLCDHYNASPASVTAALSMLSQLKSDRGRKGPLVVCLGDMLELGPNEEALHRSLAKTLGKNGVSRCYLYGERMKWLASETLSLSPTIQAFHFSDHAKLAHQLKEDTKAGSTILLKGSRGMKMENVLEAWKKSDTARNQRS